MFHVESCHSDICCIKAMTLSPSGHQIPISLFGSHRLLSSPRHSTSLSFWTTLLCVADMLARGHLAVVDRQSSWCQTLTSCHCWWLFWSYFGRQSVIPRHYFLQNSNQSLRRSSFAELSMALYLSKNLSEQELSMAQYLGIFLNKSSPWHSTSVSFWTRALHGTVPRCLSEQELSMAQYLDIFLNSSATLLICRRISSTIILLVGDRWCATAGLTIWNSLPDDVTSAISLLTFRRKLKSTLIAAVTHTQTLFCNCLL